MTNDKLKFNMFGTLYCQDWRYNGQSSNPVLHALLVADHYFMMKENELNGTPVCRTMMMHAAQ